MNLKAQGYDYRAIDNRLSITASTAAYVRAEGAPRCRPQTPCNPSTLDHRASQPQLQVTLHRRLNQPNQHRQELSRGRGSRAESISESAHWRLRQAQHPTGEFVALWSTAIVRGLTQGCGLTVTRSSRLSACQLSRRRNSATPSDTVTACTRCRPLHREPAETPAPNTGWRQGERCRASEPR
jgi:hypothetical protein